MNSADVVLEVENLDEVVLIGVRLLLRNTFSIDLCILVKVHDRMLAERLSVKSVRAGLVHPYSTSFGLARKLRLLDQCLDHVVDCTRLGDKEIVLILYNLSADIHLNATRPRTSLVMPSLSQITLMLFLVSSSARLISSTSK